MVDWNLDRSKALHLNLGHQLERDCTAVLGQDDLVKHMTFDETEVAIDVVDLEAKDEPHKVVVGEGDEPTVDRITAGEFVAHNDVDAAPSAFLAFKRRIQAPKFPNVVLAVTVRIKDQVVTASPEAGTERAPVVECFGKPDNSDTASVVGVDTVVTIETLKLVKDVPSVVGAAILHDNHFVLGGEFPKHYKRLHHHGSDRSGIVEAREEGRYRPSVDHGHEYTRRFLEALDTCAPMIERHREGGGDMERTPNGSPRIRLVTKVRP